MITFNKLNRLPTINDTKGFYAVYGTPDSDGIYIVADTKVINICQPEKWKIDTNFLHPRWNYYPDILNMKDPLNFNGVPSGYYYSELYIGIGNQLDIWLNYTNSFGDNTKFTIMYDNSINISTANPSMGLAIRLIRNIISSEENLVDGTILYNCYIDYDGNKYSGTKIGTQIWIRENIKTKHYSNGNIISNNINNINGGYTIYENTEELVNSDMMTNAYGLLYNKYILNNENNIINNNDFRIPTLDDVTLILLPYLITKYNIIIDTPYSILGQYLKSNRQKTSLLNTNLIIPLNNKNISSTIIN